MRDRKGQINRSGSWLYIWLTSALHGGALWGRGSSISLHRIVDVARTGRLRAFLWPVAAFFGGARAFCLGWQ